MRRIRDGPLGSRVWPIAFGIGVLGVLVILAWVAARPGLPSEAVARVAAAIPILAGVVWLLAKMLGKAYRHRDQAGRQDGDTD
jgi:hypothetical protein